MQAGPLMRTVARALHIAVLLSVLAGLCARGTGREGGGGVGGGGGGRAAAVHQLVYGQVRVVTAVL